MAGVLSIVDTSKLRDDFYIVNEQKDTSTQSDE